MKREESIATATTLESGARATVVGPVSGSLPVVSSLGSSLSLYCTADTDKTHYLEPQPRERGKFLPSVFQNFHVPSLDAVAILRGKRTGYKSCLKWCLSHL